MSIPCIDSINGELILGGIRDIIRFSIPSKVLAFSVLDPTVYQTGHFNASPVD